MNRPLRVLADNAKWDARHCLIAALRAISTPYNQSTLPLRQLFWHNAFSHGAAVARAVGTKSAHAALLAWLEDSGGLPTVCTTYLSDHTIPTRMCAAFVGRQQSDTFLGALLQTVVVPCVPSADDRLNDASYASRAKGMLEKALRHRFGSADGAAFNPDEIVCR